jgi:hypothetical protein
VKINFEKDGRKAVPEYTILTIKNREIKKRTTYTNLRIFFITFHERRGNKQK